MKMQYKTSEAITTENGEREQMTRALWVVAHSGGLGEAVKDGAGEQGGEEVAASLRRPQKYLCF